MTSIDDQAVSCCPDLLYSQGGYFDGVIPLDRLRETSRARAHLLTVREELFPATLPRRQPPICFGVEAAQREIDHFFQHVLDIFGYCPPGYLVEIAEALIWNNMVFVVDGDEIFPLYESYRPPDRPEQGVDLLSRLPARSDHDERLLDESHETLFVGSSGSFNYGHWLVDDFAKLGALRRLGTGRTRRVLMSSFFPAIDTVRCEGARLFLNGARDSIQLLDRTKCYRVKRLNYVTPVSYHPVLKNRNAVAFTRDVLLEAADFVRQRVPSGYDLVVSRAPDKVRQITNFAELEPCIRSENAIVTEGVGMSLLTQVSLFAGAGNILGIMGAAMANQIFTGPEVPCLFMAPYGWMEPFYWDLLSALDRPYRVYYGPVTVESADPFHRSFSVDPDFFRAQLSRSARG